MMTEERDYSSFDRINDRWPTVGDRLFVPVALADLGHGEYRRVAFPRPPLVRRPPPERREPD